MIQRLIVDPYEPDPRVINEAVVVLRAGGIVAYPTDTLYGLAVDPFKGAAAEKLFAVKERDRASAITLIAASAEQARTAGMFQHADIKLAAAFWPGPLTIVVAAAAGLSPGIASQRGTVGIRVPAHAVARALAAAFGGCITATSANVSGRSAASTPDEALAALDDRIDALLDAGPVPGGPPSTIVEIGARGPLLHRAGAVAWDRVLESLQ
jgi:L-threonylcarbamoyladenylate synthase